MKLSIWNIYHRLPYTDMIPLIKRGEPTIEGIRWLTSGVLRSDTVYIGRENEFFCTSEDNTIIVHCNDILLIHNVYPEDVFNEVSSIVERYQKWDSELIECCSKADGLTEMLARSSHLFQNPSFIYAPDGKALAIAPGFPGTIHWHWEEILTHRGLTDERLENLQADIDLTNVFLDREPTIRDSHMGNHQYMHCSLVINGYMAGHFVLFSMLHPFESGLENLVHNLIGHMVQYMTKHYEVYSPSSRLGEFIAALIHNRPYDKKEFLIFQKLLRWNEKEELYQIFIFKENVKGESVRIAKAYLKLSQSLENSVIFRENNLLVLLLNLRKILLSTKELNLILDSFAKNFYCGVSNSFKKIEQVDIYYRQALTELIRCKELQIPRSYGKDHVRVHLRQLLNQDGLNAAYVKRSLLALLEYDEKNHTQYYSTLRAWFYSGFHPTTAASILQIHRNSFNYRMERMQELISFEEIDLLAASHNIEKINEYLYSFMYLDYHISN